MIAHGRNKVLPPTICAPRHAISAAAVLVLLARNIEVIMALKNIGMIGIPDSAGIMKDTTGRE